MRSYCDLLKDGIIDFEKTLLDKYFLLDLDETECMLLLRLYQLSKQYLDNSYSLNINYLKSKMSLKEDDLSDKIANLVSKGFITLQINESDNEILEIYSLDQTYEELAYLLENNDVKREKNETSILMRKTASTIEGIVNKMLTPFEIEIIKKWFYDAKYSQENINKAIEKVSKVKNPSVQAIDRVLYSQTTESIENDDIIKAQEILKRKYGKK